MPNRKPKAEDLSLHSAAEVSAQAKEDPSSILHLPSSFSLSPHPIDTLECSNSMVDPSAGGYVIFEGRVRNHHDGKEVVSLTYQAYPELAGTEGERIVREICERYGVSACVTHATGDLKPGDLAIRVSVAAAHREAAFAACRELVDLVKARVPIWKHEFYADGTAAWVDPTEPGT